MPFLLLLLLTLVCLQSTWPRPPQWLGAEGAVAAMIGGWLMLIALGFWLSTRGRRLLRADPAERWRTARRIARFRRIQFFLSLGFFLGTLYLGWGWFVREHWPARDSRLPGLEIALLAPFLLGLLGSWWSMWSFDLALHESSDSGRSFPGRWAYIALQARHNLLLLVPPLFLLLLQETIFWAFPHLQDDRFFLPILGLALLLLAFLSIPLLLRLFLGLRSLPSSEIRTRLENLAQRLRFRCNDILVWDTRSTSANAMVTGVFPWFRYVVLTDRLLQEFDYAEIEGVFGHEVGHVKHHHMSFYLLFLAASLLGFQALSDLLDPVLTRFEHAWNWWPGILDAATLPTLVGLAFLAVYFFVVFGFLSRRCERQADIYGCRAASTQTFIDALEKVAVLNGISREKPGWLSSWQHGTIAQRVAFLEKMRDDPAVEPRFQRGVGLVKWSVSLGLGALILAVGPERVWDLLRHM